MPGGGSTVVCGEKGGDNSSDVVLGSRKDLHCSGTVWPAAYALFSHLQSYDMDGKKVLELGSGTGWLGLQLGRCFPHSHQVCTDHPDYMHALRESLSQNPVSNVEARELDWANPWSEEEFQKFGFVIGSDLVYNVYLTKILASCWRRVLDAGNSVQIVYAHMLHRWQDAGVDWPLHEACVSQGIALHVLEMNGTRPESAECNLSEVPEGQLPVIFEVRSGEMPKYSTTLLRSAVTQAEMRSMREWEMADEDERSEILMAAAISEIEW